MTEQTALMNLDDNNFEAEVLECTKPVMVAFRTGWRGSCHIMAPIVEHVAAVFAGRIKVGQLDIDRHPQIPGKYGIHRVPTLLVFVEGNVIGHIQGVISTRDLTAKLQALLDSLSSDGQPS